MEPHVSESWYFEEGSHISVFYRTNILSEALYHIVAMVVLKRFCIVTDCWAASFSTKTFFCKTNNIFYSLENQIGDKTKQWFWKYIKNIGKVRLESFRNFAYVNSYLHLKSFAWKRDYLTSQKLQMPKTLSRLF